MSFVGERNISRGARHEREAVCTSRSCPAPREISYSPHFAHKAPVMQARRPSMFPEAKISEGVFSSYA